MRPARNIVLLSTADWDNPFWTNKQHVALDLARRGRRVLYIDSVGLRRPSASVQDAQRIARRLRKAMRGPRRVRENIWVWSPVLLPLHDRALVRAFNRQVLSTLLNVQRARLGMQRATLWTYNPMTAQLLDISVFERVIYHCVDDISAQPGMPSKALAHAEQDLAQSSSIVFATSHKLAETRSLWNPATFYLPNVADYGHFSTAQSQDLRVPSDLARLPGPRIGFVGAISAYKLDFELIRYVAESHPEWSIILIGKVGEGDPWTDPGVLAGIPNLHLFGPRPYDQVPAYLKGFDVALLPNHRNEYTDSMFPMKFFEYLSAGLPVVSVDLPALRDFEHVAALCSTREGFLCAIEGALAGTCAPLSVRCTVARQHTYAARTERMLALIAQRAEADAMARYPDRVPGGARCTS